MGIYDTVHVSSQKLPNWGVKLPNTVGRESKSLECRYTHLFQKVPGFPNLWCQKVVITRLYFV